MDRLDLVPSEHRAERLFLLDVLAGEISDAQFDANALLAITPEKLYPLLYLRLKLDALAPYYRKSLLVELRRVADLRRIDATLTAAQIPFLVLKGPVLAASVYPDRAARTMTDLDLLIADEDMQRAMDVLATIGYRVPAQFAGATLEAGDAPPLIDDAPGGLALELHSMLDSLPDERAALAAMLPTARKVDVGHGLELPTLERGEFFAHVVAHVSKHHRFEGELRSLLDVALLLRADVDVLDWETLDREWQRRGISGWIALTITLAHLLLRAPMPALYRDRTQSDEALAIAAEQLWLVEKVSLPPRVLFAAAGKSPSPVHAGVEGKSLPLPSVRARATREWHRVRRMLNAIRRGKMRPKAVAADVDLFLKRERLFALVENAPQPR